MMKPKTPEPPMFDPREIKVLAYMIFSPDAMRKAVRMVKRKHFYNASTGSLYNLCRSYWDKHECLITWDTLDTEICKGNLSQEARGEMMMLWAKIQDEIDEEISVDGAPAAFANLQEQATMLQMQAQVHRLAAGVTTGNIQGAVADLMKMAEELKEMSPPDLAALSDCREFNHSDVGNGKRFVRRFSNEVRSCSAEKDGWLVWTGQKWGSKNAGSQAQELAKQTASLIADEERLVLPNLDTNGQDQNQGQRDAIRAWAQTSESIGKLKAMMETASSDPLIRANAEDMDADPWLLNVANGVVDLRTGKLLPHDPARLITQIAPVTYDAQATCPTWNAFLARVVPDTELRDYIQRAVGYTLTGIVTEQSFWFLYGFGRNGKSTFIETLIAMLGDYAGKISTSLIMEDRNGREKETRLFRMWKKRLIVASEVGEGQRIDEQILKDLTGVDTIHARQLYAMAFDFEPTHKLWFFGNHKPNIRGTDMGIWRRVRLLPFEETISPDEVDPHLPAKLRSELSGILAWAVAGCAAWQRDGKLVAPGIIADCVSDYRAEMDILGQFLSDRCMTDSTSETLSVKASDLYEIYSKWCETAGERNVYTNRVFGLKLTERGLKKIHRKNGWHYSGIGINEECPRFVARSN